MIGVEVVEDAIEDAGKNAALNNIDHARFFAGDVIKVCTDTFCRAWKTRCGDHRSATGRHARKLVNKLLEMEAPKIVYVSCNTATQARDIAFTVRKYQAEKIQPVDMFPHTHHIECVAC